MVVPYDYSRNLRRGADSTVQVLLNGVNANTAAISQGYAESVIESYNADLRSSRLSAALRSGDAGSRRGFVSLQPAFLYNPGLKGSWFVVTGVFGLTLLLNASLVAGTTMIRERERGTIEQLLMLPASTAEIVIAKIAPLFAMLWVMVVICMLLIKFAFRVPFHGSFALVTGGAALCLLCGIGVGTTIASFSKSAKQSMLLGFFVNPLLFSLSGSLNPVEGMPKWMQPLTVLNPIHHLATIVRGCLIKGSGFGDLWTNFFGLAALTLGLLTLSIWRFRGQLSQASPLSENYDHPTVHALLALRPVLRRRIPPSLPRRRVRAEWKSTSTLRTARRKRIGLLHANSHTWHHDQRQYLKPGHPSTRALRRKHERYGEGAVLRQTQPSRG